VAEVTPQLKRFAAEMLTCMAMHNGVGLAANQVGSSIRLFVMAYQNEMHVCFNPEIIEIRGNNAVKGEMCLSSMPRQCYNNRPLVVVMKWFNENGQPKQKVFTGHPARIVQHELAHLDGRLMQDEMYHCKDVERLLASVMPPDNISNPNIFLTF
jgi:peptide deformylase